MKRNNPVPNRTRQSAYAVFLYIILFAKNLLRQFWWVILLFILNPSRQNDDKEFPFLLMILAFSFISMMASIISYFRFFYYLTDKDFHLEQGILRKKSVQIPFERIQSIRVEQSLLHQALNVVKLEIDTAGSKNNELTIMAISKDGADEIRNYIFSKKAVLQKDTDSAGLPFETQQENATAPPLFQLNFGTLLKIGISQNHLRSLGIILAFFFSLFHRITEIINPQVDEYLGEIEIESFWSMISTSLLIIPVILLITVFISAIQISFRYADFAVYKTKEGLRMIFGLFTRIEQVAIQRKMQLIALETNPIRRLLGLIKVRIYQASSSELQVNESLMIPGCSKDQSNQVLSEYIDPGVADQAVFNQVDPKYRIRIFILAGCLPLIGMVILAYVNFGAEALYLLILLPIIAIISHYYYKRLKFAINSDWIIKKEGIFGQKTTFLKTYKIQNIEIYRGFYQLRHGLATVIIHTAARPVSIPFVTIEQANQLTDFLLAQVEQSNKHWM